MNSVFLVYEIEFESNDYETFELVNFESEYTKTFLTLEEGEDYLQRMRDNEMPYLLKCKQEHEERIQEKILNGMDSTCLYHFKGDSYEELASVIGPIHEFRMKELSIS